MMSTEKDLITVNATVTMTADSLQAIVATAKQMVGPDERGRYRVDTAGMVGQMISRFLLENDFEAYVNDPAHYPR
jgi:hypothetical protein